MQLIPHLHGPNPRTTRCWNPISLPTRIALLINAQDHVNGVYPVSLDWGRQSFPPSVGLEGDTLMPTSDISTITGYADSYHAGWGKKDTGSGWNQNSHVYCKRKLEVFTINLLPFGWGKTLALGFQMTALSPTPKPLVVVVFTQNNSNWKWKLCAFLLMRVLGPAFLFHSEQIRKSNGRQVISVDQRDLGGIPTPLKSQQLLHRKWYENSKSV